MINVDTATDAHIELAGKLYTIYCEQVGGVAFNGDTLPTWEEFSMDPKKVKQVEGWLAVAMTAQQELQHTKIEISSLD